MVPLLLPTTGIVLKKLHRSLEEVCSGLILNQINCLLAVPSVVWYPNKWRNLSDWCDVTNNRYCRELAATERHGLVPYNTVIVETVCSRAVFCLHQNPL
jgi:hypothetical protein